jgi:hypothetical protein
MSKDPRGRRLEYGEVVFSRNGSGGRWEYQGDKFVCIQAGSSDMNRGVRAEAESAGG